MMTVVMNILLALLLLKSVYNLTIPYSLLAKMRRNEKGGISFMPYLEVALITSMLVLSIASAAMSSQPSTFFYFGIGLGVIIFSYLHLFIVMVIGGSIISKGKSKEADL